ncbi:MAG: NAD(P)H-quinone oxidoreductase [Vulcanimicrobiaceae bacterium]
MQAIIVSQPGGPEVLTLAEVPTPQPGPGDVLIAVEAAGVCRADALQRAGRYPPPQGANPILGLECAGTICAVGEGVPNARLGERVCALCNGGAYAQFVAVPSGQVLPLPEGWSCIEAASLPENAFTVFDNLLTRAALQGGEILLVHAAGGGIGTTALMFARALGVRVIATAGTQEKRQACLDLGAEIALDSRAPGLETQVMAATGGHGVDVILETLGGDSIARDLGCIALDGRIACISTMLGARVELDIGALLARRASIFGSSLRPRTTTQKAAIAAGLRERIWPHLERRETIRPVVDTTFPLSQAADAHRRLEANLHIGKIILTI